MNNKLKIWELLKILSWWKILNELKINIDRQFICNNIEYINLLNNSKVKYQSTKFT